MDNGHGSVWKIEEGTCYGVDFRIYNKSQSEYRINPEIYIADESVLCKNDINGHPFDAPAPGKNSLMQMTIIRWDGMKEAPIDLSEFNQLNGSIRLGSGVEATYYFSIADCLEAGGPVANEELDDKTIKLDTPVVLADNNYCRMELVSFWKFNGGWHATGSSSWGKGSKYTSPSFGVDIQFYNKSQSEYDIHADAYIGNELVICHLEIGDNSWDAPAPGKNAVMKMTVARWDGEKEVPVSIEELYQLNGTIRISGGGVNQRISFSVPNAIETIG